MFVRDIMTKNAFYIHDDSRVGDAVKFLKEHGVTSLPVVDHKKRLLGTFSLSDIVKSKVDHNSASRRKASADQLRQAVSDMDYESLIIHDFE